MKTDNLFDYSARVLRPGADEYHGETLELHWRPYLNKFTTKDL